MDDDERDTGAEQEQNYHDTTVTMRPWHRRSEIPESQFGWQASTPGQQSRAPGRRMTSEPGSSAAIATLVRSESRTTVRRGLRRAASTMKKRTTSPSPEQDRRAAE